MGLSRKTLPANPSLSDKEEAGWRNGREGNEPALKQIGPNEYRATMVAQAFAFNPGELRLPKGATVHFEMTSPDVVHGLLIPGTNVNLMVIPGQITEFTYTFKESGDYALLCHEYCGVGHHLMMGRLVVQ